MESVSVDICLLVWVVICFIFTFMECKNVWMLPCVSYQSIRCSTFKCKGQPRYARFSIFDFSCQEICDWLYPTATIFKSRAAYVCIRSSGRMTVCKWEPFRRLLAFSHAAVEPGESLKTGKLSRIYHYLWQMIPHLFIFISFFAKDIKTWRNLCMSLKPLQSVLLCTFMFSYWYLGGFQHILRGFFCDYLTLQSVNTDLLKTGSSQMFV